MREQEVERVVELQVGRPDEIGHNEDGSWQTLSLEEGKRVVVDVLIPVVEGDRRHRLPERLSTVEP